MAQDFVVPESERTKKLYAEASSPSELYEIAMRELHANHPTPEAEAAAAAAARPVTSVPPAGRPQQMRGIPYYRVMYGGADGNGRAEITADNEEDFQNQIEAFRRMGWQ
jgi:hypothetical protein